MLRRFMLRVTKRGAPTDDEIARELRDHLELDAESLTSSGATSEARFMSQRRFGNVTNVNEAVREVWRWTWLEQLEQDARHGMRALGRSPLYAGAVVITLAMGIGAVSAVYSFSRAIHDPFPRLPSDRLLWITQANASCGVDCTQASPAALAALETRAPSITAIGTFHSSVALRSSNGSEALNAFGVSPNTFETMEAPFAVGRGFPKDAGQPGAPKYVILSYDFWQRRFAGSRGVVDSTISLGEQPFSVIGVLGTEVVFPTAGDVYTPFTLHPEEAVDYAARQYDVFARIAPGVSFAKAVAEVRTIGAQLVRESPKTDSGWVLRARPIADYHTDDVAILVQISGVAALLVFLAACMSAANLALSRLAARRHELTLRTALGVRRWRLARHLLTESLMLSVVASVFGTMLAWWGVHAIRDGIPADFAAFVPGWARLGLDGRTLLFALASAVLAMMAFAALPVLRATRVNLAGVLSEGGRASTVGMRSTRTRATLIVLEVSIALVLLTGATLLTRSVRNMVRGDAGVRLEHALVMHLTLPPQMTDSAQIEFYRRLDANLQSEPGVLAGGLTTTTPLSNNSSGVLFRIPGRPPEANGRGLSATDQHVTPGYAAAAGMHIEEGRMIGAQDEASRAAQRSIVVNRYMATALWPHVSALGRVVVIGDVQWRVVGVASNVYHGGLDEPLRYAVYRSLYQAPTPYASLAVWTRGDPSAMRDAIRSVVARTEPSVAVGDVRTMIEMQARHVSAFTMMGGMLAVLATVTMTIAAVGLYGLIAYGVAQRKREIGVRIALGARPADIVRQIGAGAAKLTMVGIALGVVGGLLFTRMLSVMLYRVTASDSTTFVGVSLALLTVALTAALIPSWRAARVDPTIALRD
ncbi:MAG: ADOP family duplicated permease [Gemmatimonadaceae bacterium]